MISLAFVILLFCPLLGFSKNVIKANVDHTDLKMEPAPESHSNDICGDPECNLVCTEGQVGDDCHEDIGTQLVPQDPALKSKMKTLMVSDQCHPHDRDPQKCQSSSSQR